MANANGEAAQAPEVDDEDICMSLQQFIDTWYFQTLQGTLGKKWDRGKAVHSVVHVLNLIGVKLEKYTEAELEAMDETALLKRLAHVMPEYQRSNLDNLTSHLQTCMKVAADFRTALDHNKLEEIEQVLDEQDGFGCHEQIMKQAVLFASKQVSRLRDVSASWQKNTGPRLERLYKAAELAEHAQQQVIAYEAQLEQFSSAKSGQSKKVLVNMAEGNLKTLLHSVFSNWVGLTIKDRAENQIRERFEQQIVDCEKKLFQYKEKQLANIKKVFQSQANAGNAIVMHRCWDSWIEELALIKWEAAHAGELDKMQGKINAFSSAQTENVKKVMTRMTAGNDQALTDLCFQAWVKFREEYLKNREMEDAVKASEAKIQEHLKAEKEKAKEVLNRIQGASASGLIAMCMQNWVQYFTEGKKDKEMQNMLEEQTQKFKAMNQRQSGNASKMQNRVNEQMNNNLLMRAMSAWVIDSKVERVTKYYDKKLLSKRTQITSVQSLFKNFASELERGLGHDDDSSGREAQPGRGRDGRSSKKKSDSARQRAYSTGDGGVSLPEIRA